jgi:pimeloyl-ACP methyl ester carboxylesterase/DNA-binding winged helix-turn-helix (wHTH) protein
MQDKRLEYRFDAFCIDAMVGVLYRNSAPIGLTPKAFETLLVLSQKSGQVVGKHELIARVWPQVVVEENSLAQNISLLRRTLGQNAAGESYIQTVPRRGYRLNAVVEVREESDSSPLPVPARAEEHERPLDSFTPPKVRYARSRDVNIAYQVLGDGPLDLVFVMGWVSHLDCFWSEPSFARFLRRLASFSRLIVFDKRGTGLSDRVGDLPTLEQRMDDVRAVLDAVGSKRAALCGVSEGGPMCSLYAATYPDKTAALVMIGTYARRIWDPEYPWAPTREAREVFLQSLREEWGNPVGIAERAPSRAHDPEFRDWWARYLRMGASPGAADALTRMNTEIDIRPVLPTIRVPTLVIHRTGDLCLKVEEGRYVASKIPGAKFVELPGDDHLPFVGDQESILNAIEEFLTGSHAPDQSDGVLATVMSVTADRPAGDHIGIPPWPASFDQHRQHALHQIELFRGRSFDRPRDGMLIAAFDGPARAIRCARDVLDFASHLGVALRIGIHTGEYRIAHSEPAGMAVEIARTLTSIARPREVLASRTVRDLVAGSGLIFVARGSHVFPELGGDTPLFAVQ